jgi:hypothetical protein
VISRALTGIAVAAMLLTDCGAETRGWVLWERETQILDAEACPDCTYRFALDGLSTTNEQGGTDGVRYVDVCPADGVLVGYSGVLRDVPAQINGTDTVITVVGSLRATCAAVALSDSGVAITPTAEMLPVRGDATTPATWSQTCPLGELIVGFDSQAGIFLDRVSFVCGKADIVPSTSGPTLAVSVGNALPPAGGNGGGVFQDRCPQGQVARGQSLRSGEWINSFALVCGAASFTIAGRDAGGDDATGDAEASTISDL